jgi:hypothetical protein
VGKKKRTDQSKVNASFAAIGDKAGRCKPLNIKESSRLRK